MDQAAAQAEYLKKFLDARKENKVNTSEGGNNKKDLHFPPLKAGQVTYRILPSTDPSNPVPGIIRRKHKNIPTEDNKTVNLDCMSLHGMECPICKVISEYEGAVDTSSWEIKETSWFNVLVYGDKEFPEDIPVMACFSGGFTLEWVVSQILNPQMGDITDPRTGAPVTFIRERDYGKWDRVVARMSSPIANTEEEITRILNERVKFNERFKSPDDTYLQKVVNHSRILKDRIESRLMQGSGTSSPTYAGSSSTSEKPAGDQSAPPSTGTPAESQQASQASNPTQTASQTTQSTSKPNNAPACYGNKAEYNEASDRCMICAFELDCKASL